MCVNEVGHGLMGMGRESWAQETAGEGLALVEEFFWVLGGMD